MGPSIKMKGLYGILPLGVIVNRELSDGSKVYLAFLFSVSFSNNGVSWYSQEKAGEMLGVSRWSISRYAEELTEHGIVDRINKNGLYLTRIRLEIFGSNPSLKEIFHCGKSATSNVADLQHGMLQICHTNDSKEGDQMNENGVGLPKEVPHRPDPSSILDARSKATKLSREARDKNFKKKQDRLQAVSTSDRITGIERWKGTRFYEYLKHLCSKFEITIGDMTELSKNPPEKYARTMNDIIELCNRRQLSKQDFARMLEGLTSEWKCGASGSFSGDGKLYTNALREKIDRLVSMYGPKKQSVPEVEIETIPLDELYLKKPETEVKKEDNA